MKKRTYTPIGASLAIAASLALAQSSSAAVVLSSDIVLAGWYDFDGVVGSQQTPDVFEAGFGTSVTRAFDGADTGGDTNSGPLSLYGDGSVITGSVSNDGFLAANSDLNINIDLKNTSTTAFSLSKLFFDAAVSSATPVTLSIIQNALPIETISYAGTAFAITGSTSTDAVDYSDYSVSLVGRSLAPGETIRFQFVPNNLDNSIKLFMDNVAITAIPEPTGLLSLACLLGSGLMLRRRPRANSTPATA